MFKVKCGQYTFIFQNLQKFGSYTELQQMIKAKFKHCPASFSLFYADQKGENIAIQCDGDLETFIQKVCGYKPVKKMFKLNVVPKKVIENEISVQTLEILQKSDSSSQSKIQLLDIQQKQYAFQEYTDYLRNLCQEEEQKDLQNDQIKTPTQVQQGIFDKDIKGNINSLLLFSASVLVQQVGQQILDLDNQQDLENKEIPDSQQIQILLAQKAEEQQIWPLIQQIVQKQLPMFKDQLKRKAVINVKTILQKLHAEFTYNNQK